MADLITLDEAKKHLKIVGSTFDDLLPLFIDAACEIAEAEWGPITPTVFSMEDRFTAGRDRTDGYSFIVVREIVLPQRPVISILEAFNSRSPGQTFAPDEFDLTLREYGIVRMTGRVPFPSWISLRYMAGYQTVPSWAKLATLIVLQDLWRSQRGNRQQQGGVDPAPALPGETYSVPALAVKIAARHRRMAGIG